MLLICSLGFSRGRIPNGSQHPWSGLRRRAVERRRILIARRFRCWVSTSIVRAPISRRRVAAYWRAPRASCASSSGAS